MKTIRRLWLICALPLLMLVACSRHVVEATAAKADREAKISVPEMHCSSCVGTIRGGLREVPGVEASTFDLATRQVMVRWASKKTDQAAIEQAITKAGFKVNIEVEKPVSLRP